MDHSGIAAPKAPVVFISWAHDNPAMSGKPPDLWDDKVRALAERLIEYGGCDVRFDRFEEGRAYVDWGRWGAQQIEESDFTLVIASATYKKRWNGVQAPSPGSGATREINVLKGKFNRSEQEFCQQTVVILLPGITDSDVPDEILSTLQRFAVDPLTGNGLEELLRHLTRQPKFLPPARGPVPVLPPRPPATGPGLSSSSTRGNRPPEAKEEPSAGGGGARRLPSAAGQLDASELLIEQFSAAAPPPARPREAGGLAEWRVRLAAWTDQMAALLEQIEQVGQLNEADRSVRFISGLGTARSAIEKIVSHLGDSSAPSNAQLLSGAAAELRQSVEDLAPLALARRQ
jgi:SEFIR domain